MAALPPSNPQPAGDDRNLVAANESAALSFEDRVHDLWQRNRTVILGACVAVVLAIFAKGAWDYLGRQRERELQREYAAATNSDQLKAFAAAHPNHELAGIAHLRSADEAYAAGKSADAIAAYEKAVAGLKDGPLAARAQIGRAMARVQAGKMAEAKAELSQLANDANQLKPVRAEAAYHLASLAAEAGDGAEVQKLSDLLLQIDPSSSWASRAMALRASVPIRPSATTGSAPADADGAAAPKIELNVPKKQ